MEISWSFVDHFSSNLVVEWIIIGLSRPDRSHYNLTSAPTLPYCIFLDKRLRKCAKKEE